MAWAAGYQEIYFISTAAQSAAFGDVFVCFHNETLREKRFVCLNNLFLCNEYVYVATLSGL